MPEARAKTRGQPEISMVSPDLSLAATTWKEPERYVARCSELGVASAGDSPSDTLANMREASELYLENVMLTDDLIPIKPFLQVSS